MKLISSLVFLALVGLVFYTLVPKSTNSVDSDLKISTESDNSTISPTERMLTPAESSKLDRQATEKLARTKRLQAATYKQWQNASCVLPTSSTEMDHSCELVGGFTQSQGKEAMIKAMREAVAKRLMVEQNISEMNDNLKAQAKAQIEDRLIAILDAESPETTCPKDGTACD